MKSKVVGALVALAPLISAVHGQNALKNPDFEGKDGWNHWGGVVVEGGHSGKYGLRIHNDEFKWSGTDQIVIMPEGVKTMTVTGWMKSDTLKKGSRPWENARIGVEFYDKEGKMAGGYPPTTGELNRPKDWLQYTRTYTVPAGAFSAKIQLALGNSIGTVYFDDLEVLLKGEGDMPLQAGVFKPEPMKPEEYIRLNQVGFFTSGPKVAVVVSPKSDKFEILDASTKAKVFEGALVKKGTWKYSGEEAAQADFSKFTTPGKYVVNVPGQAESFPFVIGTDPVHNLGKASLKTYYYQRTLIDLDEKYAGQWARKAGHPDTAVIVHPSAASAGRPAGSKISSPRGWYDAGDYNKYIVNSGISTYTLMALHEQYPEFADTINTNIPESGNKLPDLLDETLFNLRWMLTMQDPADGGVYHKLTNPNFDGVLMPDKAVEPRYVIMKTTAAALDFAAVLAQASRVYKNYNSQLPGFADSCIAAAKKAYDWAKKNPAIYYEQDKMSKKFKPGIVTGAYDDMNVKDEFQWAAIELFATTGDKNYYSEANVARTIDGFTLPNWQSVNTLGLITLANLTSQKVKDAKAVNARIIKLADDFKNHAKVSEFGVPMGQEEGNFVWGSNSFAANQGIILIQAYRLTKNKEYLDAAIANLDYLLGRNGTAYSYVSGFGSKSMRNPHHRPSQADGIKDPIPGFIAGGPNPGQQDKNGCTFPYPSDLPAKSYLDQECSYASNEIAINWNAPLTYLVFAIEASMAGQGK